MQGVKVLAKYSIVVQEHGAVKAQYYYQKVECHKGQFSESITRISDCNSAGLHTAHRVSATPVLPWNIVANGCIVGTIAARTAKERIAASLYALDCGGEGV